MRVQRGSWVMIVRQNASHYGIVGLVDEVLFNGRVVVRFGMGGPIKQYARSTMRLATEDEIAERTGEKSR